MVHGAVVLASNRSNNGSNTRSSNTRSNNLGPTVEGTHTTDLAGAQSVARSERGWHHCINLLSSLLILSHYDNCREREMTTMAKRENGNCSSRSQPPRMSGRIHASTSHGPHVSSVGCLGLSTSTSHGPPRQLRWLFGAFSIDSQQLDPFGSKLDPFGSKLVP
mgnify:CR=1 FL=1